MPWLPYLKFDLFAVQVDGTYFEVDANGRYESGVVLVLGKSEKNARLADARVTLNRSERRLSTLSSNSKAMA